MANAVLDGTDAVMLSGETAAGDYPRESVAMMSRIIQESETLLPERSAVADSPSQGARALDITEAVAVGAVATATRIRAALIGVATVSGRSAQAISKERCRVPVLAICQTPRTAAWVNLIWVVVVGSTRWASVGHDSLLVHIVD